MEVKQINKSKDWQETVTLPDRITPEQFGVSKVVFNRSVRNQPLKVTGVFGRFHYVEVEGETYGIHESDLKTDHESKAAPYDFTIE